MKYEHGEQIVIRFAFSRWNWGRWANQWKVERIWFAFIRLCFECSCYKSIGSKVTCFMLQCDCGSTQNAAMHFHTVVEVRCLGGEWLAFLPSFGMWRKRGSAVAGCFEGDFKTWTPGRSCRSAAVSHQAPPRGDWATVHWSARYTIWSWWFLGVQRK